LTELEALIVPGVVVAVGANVTVEPFEKPLGHYQPAVRYSRGLSQIGLNRGPMAGVVQDRLCFGDRM
jgi:hypothetical protein